MHMYSENMVEIQQRGIEFLRSVQKVGTSYRALGLAERSSGESMIVFHFCLYVISTCKAHVLFRTGVREGAEK